MARLGADPQQLFNLSTEFTLAGTDLLQVLFKLKGAVDSVDWTGPDASRFRETWADHEKTLAQVSRMLSDAGAHLASQAAEQVEASGY